MTLSCISQDPIKQGTVKKDYRLEMIPIPAKGRFNIPAIN